MTNLGTIQFGDDRFNLEEANLYGIYEPDGFMTWHIELFSSGEDNYIMFNSLVFPHIFRPEQLTEVSLNETAATGELYEHTVFIGNENRFLDSVDMKFGSWDRTNQTIEISGKGMVQQDDELPAIAYAFDATLQFKDIHIFETSKNLAEFFVDTYFSEDKERLRIKMDEVASGWQAVISGTF